MRPDVRYDFKKRKYGIRHDGMYADAKYNRRNRRIYHRHASGDECDGHVWLGPWQNPYWPNAYSYDGIPGQNPLGHWNWDEM